ncbi:MAG: aldehyde ferredoxin oxidoreductase family protein [Desulfobacterales bacterium]|nr:aldehyde ferredoxin oxidoreductase family protein [Desulfobacterales bacterium]
MKTIRGTSNKYLDINLTDKTWRVHTVVKDDLKKFIGGKGLGLKIYFDRLKNKLKNVEPLDADNLIIFSNGVLLSTGAPCSARFEVITKSPLTGLMVASSCGGPFGEACKTAGWDGVIISGKAKTPTVIKLSHDSVEFEEASTLWGKGTQATQKALNMSVREAAVVIGPAGENLVSYANVCSGHRFAGRGGIGAVLGSKNLKAVVACGKTYKNVPVLEKMFSRTVDKSKRYTLRNGFINAFRLFGTNANTRHGIRTGYTPVRNFRDRYDPRTDVLSGENMADRYKTRHSTCRYCNVLCGHKGHYPDGTLRQIPEYETMGMFGSNIENYDPDKIGEWNDLMNEFGMDTISAGSCIAWAMEAGEKGIRKTKLSFKNHDNISAILEDIAFQRGEGYDLAKGVRWMSHKYGGESFAIHTKGLEIAAYDPRASWGHGLSYAVHNKGGCHLGSYLVGMEAIMEFMPAYTTLGKHEWVAFLEDIYAGINSLQSCLFTAFAVLTEPVVPKYIPKPMLKASMILFPKLSMLMMNWSIYSRLFWSITGIRMTQWDFKLAGERINKLERHMNVAMGLTPEDDTLPLRFTNEAVTKYPKKSVVPIQKMVRRYYRVRKYNPATGGPIASDLQHLGIH